MSGHTPGPWRLGRGDRCVISDSPLPDYSGGTGHDDADFYGGHLIAESIWRPDDARLIAAAPDSHNANIVTVAALRDVYHIADDADDQWIYDELGTELSSAYFMARAAIAKATGEQP